MRACAVVLRDGPEVVVLASAGYDRGTMSAGARRPLDAGLRVMQAVRTAAPVVQGGGPSWVAVPFGRRDAGALLLSLDGAPPADVAPLERIAAAAGAVLRRAPTRSGPSPTSRC